VHETPASESVTPFAGVAVVTEPHKVPFQAAARA
jgi:hypothetical protein